MSFTSSTNGPFDIMAAFVFENVGFGHDAVTHDGSTTLKASVGVGKPVHVGHDRKLTSIVPPAIAPNSPFTSCNPLKPALPHCAHVMLFVSFAVEFCTP